jgi:hypothetical protein
MLALQVFCFTESNRVHLVLFGMQNRTLGPYLAAFDRILIAVMLDARLLLYR